MKAIYFFLLAALCSTALTAQVPTLMADANAGAEDAKPADITAFGESVLYRAQSADEGIELWISDGTPEGTMLLKDINTDPSVSRGNSSPGNFFVFDGKAYFRARSATEGSELWITDGTPEGTTLLKDIQEGGNGSPFDFIAYNGLVYFTANNGNDMNSSELWVTDGTPDGTRLAVDINPGAENSNPNNKTIFQNKMFFSATDATVGNELWMSDGTPEGTMLVKDIRPNGNSTASRFFPYNGELYFRANDGSTGSELWKTDGTEAGTVRVSDIRAGSGSSAPSDFFIVAGNLFFVANDGDGKELWITNGDSTSTRKIVDFNPGGAGDPREFTQTIDGEYWFVADTSDADDGALLYRLGLGDTGLSLSSFGGVLPALGGTDPEDLTFTGAALYFSFEGPATGRELAYINLVTGTLFGVPEVAEGAASGEIDDITLAGNRIFYEAQDTLGLELYSSLAAVSRISFALADGTQLAIGDTIDFGGVTPGFSAQDFLVVQNTGTVGGLITSGNFAAITAPFNLDLGDFAGAVSPDPTMYPNLELTYAPATTGDFLDTLILTATSTGDDFFFFFLKGSTVVPAMSVAANAETLASAVTLDFGDVPTNLDSLTTVTISNDGEGLLVIDSVSLATGMDFSATALKDTLAQGESATVDVTFAPTETGDFSDLLTVVSNMAADFTLNLTGTAIVNSITDLGIPAKSIYPNPVADRLTVELTEPLTDGQWRLFSATGQEMRQGIWPAGQTTHYLQIGELPTGIYHLEVSSGTDRLTAKVIKR